MINKNLPVLLLREVLVFPFSEVRLEFELLEEKQLFSLADAYYDNYIMIVVPEDPLEVDPEITELPKIGVIGKIKMKMDMPNGKTRVIITGISRAKILGYTKEDELFEASIEENTRQVVDEKVELAYMRTLTKKFDSYVKEVPYLANNVFPSYHNAHNIDELTDLIALTLSVKPSRKKEYLYELDAMKRSLMILDDIDSDLEILKIEKELDGRLAKELDQNQKEYVLREKIRLMKEELGDINDKDSEIDTLKEQIEKLKCPDTVKDRLRLELSRYEATNINSPELGMIKSYIDYMLSLPWNTYTEDMDDLHEVRRRLDETHFGLVDVKMRILEHIAVSKKTNGLTSPILCLVGPPGVGKTTLAKSIAQSIGRNIAKISVGGVNDEAEIVGHRRTYIGAEPGLIIKGMKKAKSNNPVFIIDEIDKMTKSVKGDPASSLLEVLDKEQNMNFVDHYIEEEYDLSHVMFITTANDLSQIPDALRDRLEIIRLSSYTEYEKLDIAKNHFIKKLVKEHGLKEDFIKFQDSAILSIIRGYTKEAGVRELERLLSSILRKIVVEQMLEKEEKEVFITEEKVEEYLGKKEYSYDEKENFSSFGVVNGLAYTIFGGDILKIEATMYPGKGELVLTGSLGEVMRESARISLSYIKSHADSFHIPSYLFQENDIHIHVPEGAVPKDGPSAGITLTTCLISLFTRNKVHPSIAMTGEMTLRGKILPIGGLKEKTIGAHRAGIKKIYLPRENEKDLEEVPKEIKKDIKFIFVDTYQDIYHDLFYKFKRKGAKEHEYIPIQFPID